MARFQLNSKALQVDTEIVAERVRIGSISVFALVVIVCLAVLAVLAFSTANASLVMSERQATATSELYLDERAAQEFLAGVDDVLSGVRGGSDVAEGESAIELQRDARGNVVFDQYGNLIVNEQGEKGPDRAPASRDLTAAAVKAVSASLTRLRDAAQDATDGLVTVTAAVNDNRINAEFTCENGRVLAIVVTIRDTGTYRIDRWKMSAVQNGEEPVGQLLITD